MKSGAIFKLHYNSFFSHLNFSSLLPLEETAEMLFTVPSLSLSYTLEDEMRLDANCLKYLLFRILRRQVFFYAKEKVSRD